MIKISDITIDNLKNGVLKKDLPEFHELEKIFENNGWHHETTFEHVLMVLGQYEKILSQYDLSFLDKTIVNNTKKDLLRIAILLHDISKNDTCQINDQEITTFPNHEKEGGVKAGKILEKFDMDIAEKEYVSFIISNHGQPHVILSDREKCDWKLQQLKAELAGAYQETMLMAMVDTMGSKLKDNNKEEYNFRMEKYKINLEI